MEEENHKKIEEDISSVSNDDSISSDISDSDKIGEVKEVEEKKPITTMAGVPNHNSIVKVRDEQKLTKTMRENPWMLSTIVLGVIVLALLFLGNFSGGVSGNVVASDIVGENLVEYLNTIAEEDVTLVGVEDDGSMYLVTVDYKGEDLPIYVTKDGEYYTPSLLPIVQGGIETVSEVSEVPKSDNPVSELFIMTHCPYGTQAEKGLIPTIEALGDSADVKIRFVHYFMHDPEETETPRQVCIREEQADKFIPYLRCFLEDGDSSRCVIESGVDEDAVNECISSGKAEEYYAEDSVLSQSYGVQGSPTLVVNGVIASSGRDSQSYLNTICSAFNNIPEVCMTAQVSDVSPSPMWGWDVSGSATTAQC